MRLVSRETLMDVQVIDARSLSADNCLDRHAEQDPNRVALIWEKDEPGQHEQLTYRYVEKGIKL